MTRELEDMYMLMTDLRIWLELEIPACDDGDGFVQEEVIDELDAALEEILELLKCTKDHHEDRISLMWDWVQYPNVLDYPFAIALSDRFDHVISRSALQSMLRLSGGMMMRLERNWGKVIDPQGVSTGLAGGVY
ncbi:uncharacterized protein MKK02DRAFT_41200 [Dioszegia hungarica]|uniref:Proteasome activator PA28 C-terminal domain-containing protein n=1 Tax=Dioszegia hungarica TaxID=4972 RepID=A0AA38H381_9TREE|nr:uncharacterized protein MKK02DRAFT_41200 [Dioszegia hungarica]KAI9632886.1 hypothetical protein MKK02DRAFT_41200 [Dioszegia hungarica]